jgi:aryl-alcohol dehydrogenase-like predicted oxidoreductase
VLVSVLVQNPAFQQALIRAYVDFDSTTAASCRRGTERAWKVIDAAQKVADDRGVSVAEIALAWVTDRPGVSSTAVCRVQPL